MVKLLKSKLFWLSLSLFLLSVPLTACGNASQTLSGKDRAEIYAAVIRYVYTTDHTFGSNSPPFSIIYIPRSVDDKAGNPTATDANSSILSTSLQTAIITNLKDLPVEFKWIDDKWEVVDRDKLVVIGHGAIITVGNIYHQEDGKVHIAGSIYFSGLGAGGTTYIVESINGKWEITGSTGVRWIS